MSITDNVVLEDLTNDLSTFRLVAFRLVGTDKTTAHGLVRKKVDVQCEWNETLQNGIARGRTHISIIFLA